MSESQVQDLERKVGTPLPSAYRTYLVSATDKLLDAAIVFQPPRSGVVDEILTAVDVLANDAAGQIGIPDETLMHIGGNLLGGYLYLTLSNEDFGKVLYMENYTLKETFPSFEDLLAEPREEPED